MIKNLFATLLALTAVCGVQANDLYKASRQIDMRPPSVPLITSDTYYLLEYGLDPVNQVCTDDFAGHLAHNANLSAHRTISSR